MFTPSGSSLPLLGAKSGVFVENESLKEQVNELSFRILQLRKENKALREENSMLRNRYKVNAHEKLETKQKTAAKKPSPEPSVAGQGYQLGSHCNTKDELSAQWRLNGDTRGDACYVCGTHDALAKCAATDCERRICAVHSNKMLMNSEVFCEACYAHWSNAIPTEFSILAKRIFGS
mmetsp:Transcript_17788/g.24858  ORF Transcript_17788/g.24858 Transcript_17788/m.24858 type:complete len:177 (-) Transcript_17788:206-736(-)